VGGGGEGTQFSVRDDIDAVRGITRDDTGITWDEMTEVKSLDREGWTPRQHEHKCGTDRDDTGLTWMKLVRYGIATDDSYKNYICFKDVMLLDLHVCETSKWPDVQYFCNNSSLREHVAHCTIIHPLHNISCHSKTFYEATTKPAFNIYPIKLAISQLIGNTRAV
jgi:hypothetical protein